MKRVGGIGVILCLLLCACAPNAPAVEAEEAPVATVAAEEVTLPTAEPTAVATPVPTPTATPTPSPTPEPTAVPEWAGGVDDNGVDGVGTVRGNTNGNLAVGGEAVSDGNVICYFRLRLSNNVSDYGWQARYRNKGTGKDILLVSGDSMGSSLYLCLNLYRGYVYYLAGSDGGAWRVPVSGGEPELLQEGKVYFLLAAYGEIYMTVSVQDESIQYQTMVLDADTLDPLRTVDRFRVFGAMYGRLYGISLDITVNDGKRKTEEVYASITPDGRDRKVFPIDDAYSAIPCCGYLYILPYIERWKDPDTESRIVKINVDTGEMQEFGTGGFYCSGYMNVTEKYLYLQADGYDYSGDIWRMPVDGGQPERFDRRVYATGIPLVGDRPANNFVPCDESY